MQRGKAIALQAFTRVHLVPRVNGTAAAALVFERQDQEPLAMSLPLEVMGQVFGVFPQVIGLTAAQGEGGSVPPGPPLAPATWTPDGLDLQVEDAQARLLLRVAGVQVYLQPSTAQLQALAAQLAVHLAPVPTVAKRVAKPRARKGESEVVVPEASSEKPAPVKKRRARQA